MGGAWIPAEVPIHSRLVRLQWGRAFVVDVGPGPGPSTLPPVVMIHDVFETSFAFHDVTPRLVGKRRVVAPDLPGCGDSDHPRPETAAGYAVSWLAEAVGETISAVGVDRCDLVAQGFGAAIAVRLAATFARRVRRLVLVGPMILTTELPLRGAPGVWPLLGPEVFRRAFRRSDLRRVLEQTVSTAELVRDSRVNVAWDRLGRDGAREATHAMLEQVSHLDRLRERLSEVQAPTLLVWGDRDALVPPEHGEELAGLLRDARLEVVDGCGHSVAEERPERLAGLIADHCGPEGVEAPRE